MTAICHINDIPEHQARGFDIDGKKLLVAKKNGELYVYLNSCPHTGINLDWQPDDFMSFDNRFLQCATHGALFQISDGYCIAGPCQGQGLKPVPFELVDGRLFLL